jgi:hypothetical protein
VEELEMDVSLMLLSEWRALETGAWLNAFVQWLSLGVGALLASGIAMVVWQNLMEWRGGPWRADGWGD